MFTGIKVLKTKVNVWLPHPSDHRQDLVNQKKKRKDNNKAKRVNSLKQQGLEVCPVELDSHPWLAGRWGLGIEGELSPPRIGVASDFKIN